MMSHEVLNALELDWEAKAKVLMTAKKTFVVLNFGFMFDGASPHLMALDMDYQLDLDPENRTARFSPRLRA